MNNITITCWDSLIKPSGKKREFESFSVMSETLASISNNKVSKKWLPVWSPAIYKDDYRKGENVQQINLVVFDYDGFPENPDQTSIPRVTEVLKEFGINASIIPSFSNSSFPPNKARIVIAVSRPFLPDENESVMIGTLKFLNLEDLTDTGEIDGKCIKDPSRGYLKGGVANPDFFKPEFIAGDPIDVDKVIGLVPAEELKSKVVKATRQVSSRQAKLKQPKDLDELRIRCGAKEVYFLLKKTMGKFAIVKTRMIRSDCPFNSQHKDCAAVSFRLDKSKLPTIMCHHESCDQFNVVDFLENCSDVEILEAIQSTEQVPDELYQQSANQIDILQELQNNCFVSTDGGKTRIGTEKRNSKGQIVRVLYDTKESHKDFFGNQRVFVATENGLRPMNPSVVWFNSPTRRTYSEQVFEPGKVIEDPNVYNYFTGFPLEPKPGKCGWLLEVLFRNICCEDETLYNYVLDYVADIFQNPGKKPGICLIFIGPQGIGKGTFFKAIGQLLGRYFVHVSDRRHLLGNFNQHMHSALMLFADEAIWPGDKSAEGIIKAMITEETRMLERKGIDAVQVSNHTRIVMATNEDWAAPAEMDDRRFVAIQTVKSKEIYDLDFKRVYDQLENGGYEALFKFLLERDLEGVDLRDRPKTSALLEQKLATLDLFSTFWFDLLNDSAHQLWEGGVQSETLYEEFCALRKEKNSRGLSMSEFGKKLSKMAAGLSKERRSENGYRPHYYVVDSLESCRKKFIKMIGHQIVFED